MLVRYVSPMYDGSGYAEAARNNIAALHSVGVPLQLVPVSFENKKCNLGKMKDLLEGLSTTKGNPDVAIVHATPPNYPRLRQKGCYNIGYAAWETSHLPPGWAAYCNLLNEIWVPSTYNVEVFRRSGVSRPIRCVPHTLDIADFTQNVTDITIDGLSDDSFVFYSIFQWLERKNPAGLLKAYLTEFKPEEKVSLILKTYFMRAGVDTDHAHIREAILKLKASLHMPELPNILLISALLDRDQMHALHHRGDCYISLFRSEGFGLPVAEAMLMGKPVICSDYSGVTDFVDQNVAYPVKCYETPVSGMPWDIYQGDMTWGAPDIMDARRQMRWVFEHRDEARAKGQLAAKRIPELLSWDRVGNLMKGFLETVGTK